MNQIFLCLQLAQSYRFPLLNLVFSRKKAIIDTGKKLGKSEKLSLCRNEVKYENHYNFI